MVTITDYQIYSLGLERLGLEVVSRHVLERLSLVSVLSCNVSFTSLLITT
jgi:hypothetical protein